MLKIERNEGTRGRPCDTCFSAASAVFCRADLAYLCTACDARVHAAAPLHDRVIVCDSCERAPAAFLCKADSASLCAACDADIHSANPLARRHHRVPIQPIYGPNSGGFVIGGSENSEDEDEAASWLLMGPVKNGDEEQSVGGPALFGGEVEEYLDLDDYNSCKNNNQFNEGLYNHQQYYGGDSIVPNPIQYHHKGLEAGGYGYAASISQTVSISSMEVGVVPESTSEVSMSHARPPKGTIDLFSSPPIQVPTQLSPMDREARVLRYREKKKSRKFEKTIRYASRKAYAETRPRIKGRFAKRRDAQVQVEVEVDQMFSSHVSLMADAVYGVVPSF